MIKKARRNYELNVLKNGKNNDIFKLLGSKSGRILINNIRIGDQVLTEDKDIADSFAHFYTSKNIYSAPNMNCDRLEEEIWFTNKFEVVNIIKGLKDSFSYGIDGISNYLLKRSIEFYSELLMKITNVSLIWGRVPNNWKIGIISPKFKKGDRGLMQNYRPITLTSSLSKVVERIILNRLDLHIMVEKVFPDNMHGFVRGCSTISNLFNLTNRVVNCLENKKGFDVIYLDLSQAYDTIRHDLLIGKMRKLNFPGCLICWVLDFLFDRYIRVEVNGTISDYYYINNGVPQGAVVSPVLFNIFLSDIAREFCSNSLFFADDIKVFGEIIDNNFCYLQTILESVVDMIKDNELVINEDKTFVMNFGKNCLGYKYLLNNKQLSIKKVQKDLGMVMDCELKFMLILT